MTIYLINEAKFLGRGFEPVKPIAWHKERKDAERHVRKLRSEYPSNDFQISEVEEGENGNVD